MGKIIEIRTKSKNQNLGINYFIISFAANLFLNVVKKLVQIKEKSPNFATFLNEWWEKGGGIWAEEDGQGKGEDEGEIRVTI